MQHQSRIGRAIWQACARSVTNITNLHAQEIAAETPAFSVLIFPQSAPKMFSTKGFGQDIQIQRDEYLAQPSRDCFAIHALGSPCIVSQIRAKDPPGNFCCLFQWCAGTGGSSNYNHQNDHHGGHYRHHYYSSLLI